MYILLGSRSTGGLIITNGWLLIPNVPIVSYSSGRLPDDTGNFISGRSLSSYINIHLHIYMYAHVPIILS